MSRDEHSLEELEAKEAACRQAWTKALIKGSKYAAALKEDFLWAHKASEEKKETNRILGLHKEKP